MSLAAPPKRRSPTLPRLGVLVALGLAAFAAHAWYGLRNHFFDLMIYREAICDKSAVEVSVVLTKSG